MMFLPLPPPFGGVWAESRPGGMVLWMAGYMERIIDEKILLEQKGHRFGSLSVKKRN